MTPELVAPRGQGRRRGLAAASAVLIAIAAIAALTASHRSATKPSVESMYHMWLGPNGLPLSPRKQRGLLFQFCTTNFVTEAEMRYCYARLLSVGNPSGPVKFSGQPQYDSEQVVSPLFTFSAPPMEGGEEGGEEGAEEKASVGSAQLAMPPQAKAPQLAMTAQRATTPSAPLQAKGPVTALYQNKGATLTRTGGQHVQYAQGYKAGVAAAKKALLHEQALAAAKSRVSNTVAHK